MFSVDLTVRPIPGGAIVALSGELDAADVPDVAVALSTAIAAHGPSIIVDLAGLKYISCGGLGILVRLQKVTRASGGGLALAAPRGLVHEILQATGLLTVFSVHPSVEHAAGGTRAVEQGTAPAVQQVAL
jgi:anti-sigma B factor antagonist